MGREHGSKYRPDMRTKTADKKHDLQTWIQNGTENGHKRPKGRARKDIAWIASQPEAPKLFSAVEEIITHFPEAAAKAHKIEEPTLQVSPPDEELVYLSDVPVFTDPVEMPQKKPRIVQPHSVHLSYYEPNADDQPVFRDLAKHYVGSRHRLAAMEAIAHVESPVKNERSQVYVEHEKRKRERYLANHPDMTRAQYDRMRKAQIEQMKKGLQKRVVDNVYRTVQDTLQADDEESPRRFLGRHLGIATEAIEDIHRTVFPGSESPLRNEVQLPSISPFHDMMTYLSPNTDQMLREQIKGIYLTADTTAKIEKTNPKNKAGRKLAMIQRLIDRRLLVGKTGETRPHTVEAVFNEETILQEVIKPESGITEEDLPPGYQIKARELPMRVMHDDEGNEILMYTNANEKNLISGVAKAFKKAKYRSEKPGGTDDIDPTHDVTDTYRIKFAVMGGDKEIGIVMDRVLDTLLDPNNKKHLVERDEYGRPIRTAVDAEIVKDIEDDSHTNGTNDQTKETVFRHRIQVHFTDLPHPVEIMFQTMDEFLRGEYNVGHYDEVSGGYSGAAHELYTIKRDKLAAGVLFNKDVYTDPDHRDLEGSAEQAMDIKALELQRRDVIFTAKAA